MNMHDTLTIALIAVAVLNSIVSIAIAISAYYNGRQKVMQIVLVWAAPLLGSVVFGLFLWSQRGNAPPTGYPSTAKTPLDDVGAIWSGLHQPDKGP
jgi:hypothetical protein